MKELRSIVDVGALEESMVQRLRLGDGEVTDEKIQDKLDEVFKGQTGKSIRYIIQILLVQCW